MALSPEQQRAIIDDLPDWELPRRPTHETLGRAGWGLAFDNHQWQLSDDKDSHLVTNQVGTLEDLRKAYEASKGRRKRRKR